ncbi:MAG: hypothetical protein RIR11_1583 [Bacteroidota bacterium]|jgi:hypothetical protein
MKERGRPLGCLLMKWWWNKQVIYYFKKIQNKKNSKHSPQNCV